MATHTRRLNWQQRLREWARGEVGRPFVWGETDCHSLVRRGLEIMLGHAVDAPMFSTRRDAARLRDAGWVGGDGLARLGFTRLERGPRFAWPGDVLLETNRPFPSLLLMTAPHHALTGEYGAVAHQVKLRHVAIDAQLWRWHV